MNNVILLIIGMMLVTYIPRLLPFIMVTGKKLPDNVNRFLEFVPYTALGALIIPGVFSATPEMPQASLIGIVFCLIFAWYKGGIIISVLGSVIVTLVTLMINNGFVF